MWCLKRCSISAWQVSSRACQVVAGYGGPSKGSRVRGILTTTITLDVAAVLHILQGVRKKILDMISKRYG